PQSDLAPREPLTALHDCKERDVRGYGGERLPRAAVLSRLLCVKQTSTGNTKEGNAAKCKHCGNVTDDDHVGGCKQPEPPKKRVAGDPQDTADDFRAIKQRLRSHDNWIWCRKPGRMADRRMIGASASQTQWGVCHRGVTGAWR